MTSIVVDPIAEKVCKICGKLLPIEMFSPTGKFRSGITRHHIYCKTCYRAYRRNGYDPEKPRKRIKEPPEISAARMAKLRASDPEHYREYGRAYRAENPKKLAAIDRKKRAKRRAAVNATVDKITRQQWESILDDHCGRCFYCGLGFEKMTMDHFTALARGGDHSIDNIVPACSSCNTSKNAQDPFIFSEKKGRTIVLKEDIKKSEKNILNEILISITAIPGTIFWRNNTGSLPTPHGTRINFGIPGSPDILGAYRGRFVGIEVKTKSGRQSDAQKNFQRAFAGAGGIYIVAHSPQQALDALAKIA
jgi:5-methylcytosine-specific restriction endonuclease McrA